MLREEFIDRTGFEPMGDEYNDIQTDYLMFNGDKDDFCREWKKSGKAKKLMRERADKIEELRRMVITRDRIIDRQSENIKRLHERTSELTEKINEAAEESETLGKALTAANSKLARMKYILQGD